jgi:hypothetical protein
MSKLTNARIRDLLGKPGRYDPLQDSRTSGVPTFGSAADDYIAKHERSWKNDKHVAQWKMTLRDYCAPIRSIPVDKIDTVAVLRVLTPLPAHEATRSPSSCDG